MKKLLLILVLVLFPVFCFATSNVTFEWDANSEADLAGYRLYQSAASGNYIYGQGNEVLDIAAGTVTGTINVTDGTYFWVLTAYDTDGNESDPSNEVTRKLDATRPSAPSGLSITVIIKIENP